MISAPARGRRTECPGGFPGATNPTQNAGRSDRRDGGAGPRSAPTRSLGGGFAYRRLTRRVEASSIAIDVSASQFPQLHNETRRGDLLIEMFPSSFCEAVVACPVRWRLHRITPILQAAARDALIPRRPLRTPFPFRSTACASVATRWSSGIRRSRLFFNRLTS